MTQKDKMDKARKAKNKKSGHHPLKGAVYEGVEYGNGIGMVNAKHKAVVDYYLSGLTRTEAYKKVYPSSLVNITEKAYALFRNKHTQNYLQYELERLGQELEIPKHEFVNRMMEYANLFGEVVDLGSKDVLSEAEEEKFKRMRSIVTQRDVVKSFEIIARMLGYNEPEKIDMRQLKIKANFK